jgi:hypothetical protein
MPVRVFSQKVRDKSYDFCEFVTLTHWDFSNYYDLFYPCGAKRITLKLAKELNNPLSLAVWFMDDGSADYAGVALNTQCFLKSEVELLRFILSDNFDI